MSHELQWLALTKQVKAKLTYYAILNHNLSYSIPLVEHGQDIVPKSWNFLKIIVIIIIVLSQTPCKLSTIHFPFIHLWVKVVTEERCVHWSRCYIKQFGHLWWRDCLELFKNNHVAANASERLILIDVCVWDLNKKTQEYKIEGKILTEIKVNHKLRNGKKIRWQLRDGRN